MRRHDDRDHEKLGPGLAWAGFCDVRRVHPLRSMLVFAVGALCGLALAGYGLFTARGTVIHAVPAEDAALVNQRPILRTDFIAQTEAETGKPFGATTPAERAKVLGDMVREELFVQRGLELDFPGTDPDTRNALVTAVERQVVADVTTTVPTDVQLKAYFDVHRQHYASEGEMTLHHFLLPAPTDAQAAMATAGRAADALRAGIDPVEALKLYGMQEVALEHGGAEQFYFAARIHLGAVLFAQAVNLGDGDVGAPVAAADGIHVLQMIKNVRPVPLAFDRVRSQVLGDYVAAAKQRLEAADERYLREKADILIADDLKAAAEAAGRGSGPLGDGKP
jgi:hypothetical protein